MHGSPETERSIAPANPSFVLVALMPGHETEQTTRESSYKSIQLVEENPLTARRWTVWASWAPFCQLTN